MIIIMLPNKIKFFCRILIFQESFRNHIPSTMVSLVSGEEIEISENVLHYDKRFYLKNSVSDIILKMTYEMHRVQSFQSVAKEPCSSLSGCFM